MCVLVRLSECAVKNNYVHTKLNVYMCVEISKFYVAANPPIRTVLVAKI